jgi:hypothetical protein
MMLSAPLSLPVAATIDALNVAASLRMTSARVIVNEFFMAAPGNER